MPFFRTRFGLVLRKAEDIRLVLHLREIQTDAFFFILTDRGATDPFI